MIVLSVFHINTVNGYLSGFILYSQMVTLQFPGLGYSSLMPNCGASMQYNYQALNIPLIVYSMWNLNFLILDPIPFCIPHVDTAVRAIALQYCIAVCPLLFIAVTYLWIHCYDNGYRFVVFITRPVHQLLARCIWQNFKIQRSLIDTYAGLIILSYMRFLATSVKLLQFTRIRFYDEENSFSHLAFFYDANLPYFGWPHVVYGVLAIVCLLVFVVPPTVVLLFYHLQCFQRCLTWGKLDRPGLHALVDACQGCFKNSATDGSERRYFAGICLLFRVLYVSCFLASGFFSSSVISFLQAFIVPIFSHACISFVLAAMVVILRPYKKTSHNFINCLLFFYMFLISEVSVINLIPLPNVKNIYFEFSSVLYIPFLVLCLYFIYQLCKHCIKHVQKRRNVVENQLQDDSDAAIDAEQAPLLVPVMNVVMGNCEYVADDLYTDRVLNPGGYNEQHAHYQPLENSTQ